MPRPVTESRPTVRAALSDCHRDAAGIIMMTMMVNLTRKLGHNLKFRVTSQVQATVTQCRSEARTGVHHGRPGTVTVTVCPGTHWQAAGGPVTAAAAAARRRRSRRTVTVASNTLKTPRDRPRPSGRGRGRPGRGPNF